MQDQEKHPGLLAVELHASYVQARNKSRELREEAARLRREAKAAALTVDAANLRKQAKPLSDQAKALTEEAGNHKAAPTQKVLAAAELLNKRMPAEFSTWGIMKTRAYAKVLGVLIAQTKRLHPNLSLAAGAIHLLLHHPQWGDEILPKLVTIASAPRELPSLN